MRRQAERGEAIRERALARLTERGILESTDSGTFFLSRRVSRARRYRPSADETVRDEVRLRIMRALFSDDIPDPRDTVIICLAAASGIFERILSRSELADAQDRIDLVQKLDLIGQSVTRAVRAAEARPPGKRGRPATEIPSAPGLPVLGNALSLRAGAGDFLLKQYRALGPIFRVGALNRRFIVLAGPEANRFLASNDAHFRTRELWHGFDTELGAMQQIMSMGGVEHARMRKHQAPVYSRKLVENRMADAIDIARRDIARWPDDTPIPVQYVCQRIVLEQLGRLAAGTSPGTYLDDVIVYFDTLLAVHFAGSLPRLALHRPRVRRARRRVQELFRRIVADHEPERRRDRAPDYIDDVLALHRADPRFMPETDLPVTVLGPFLVGLETAATICACMLYALLKHPDVLGRMTAEVDALFARGVPALRDLRELDVTHRVAMETMRRWPLGPAVPRLVANSFEFQGYTVPAGERVLVAFTLPHRMAEYFPDPDRFDIDRYTDERAEHRQPGVYHAVAHRRAQGVVRLVALAGEVLGVAPVDGVGEVGLLRDEDVPVRHPLHRLDRRRHREVVEEVAVVGARRRLQHARPVSTVIRIAASPMVWKPSCQPMPCAVREISNNPASSISGPLP